MNDTRTRLPVRDVPLILLVEDSRTQALQLSHYLEQNGLRVVCAASAELALQQLNRELPDLIITDLNLPGMSGDALCMQVRMNVNTRGIPIILFTSEQGADVEEQSLGSGADDYVSKASDHEILLLRVQVLLRKSKAMQVLASGNAHFATPRVLVVDDSATFRQFLTGAFEEEHYRFAVAATGAEALEKISRETFDVIVLDLILPDMSGMDVCREFARSRRTADSGFLIMALTGQENAEDMNAVLSAGADDVVGKSRDIRIIKSRLAALVRRKLLYEENHRIVEEFRDKERTLLQERAQKQALQVRADLAGKLEVANEKLETTLRELRETQSQLVQSAKMASIGQLVAGVAHEINNPLAFVMSHQHTVLRLLDEIDAETKKLPDAAQTKLAKAGQRLRDMGDGLERMRVLVLQLRTFSRLDEGERKYVDIVESIESTLVLLKHKLGDRIRIKLHYAGPRVVGCYPGPLNQVIMNLLSNAIDAIDGPGEISIATGEQDRMFFIAISDTGKGMSQEVQDRIFEPFYTTKPVGQGTGLGLSISYGIVQKHHGRLEVSSTPGKGTTMVIRLPLNRQTQVSCA